MKHKKGITAEERTIVSRIHWLMSKPGILRASLVEMKRVCGNKNCRCAKGKLHRSVYLSQSKEGKMRMLYVPVELEGMVKEWTDKNKEIRELLDALSQIYWKRIKERRV